MMKKIFYQNFVLNSNNNQRKLKQSVFFVSKSW